MKKELKSSAIGLLLRAECSPHDADTRDPERIPILSQDYPVAVIWHLLGCAVELEKPA